MPFGANAEGRNENEAPFFCKFDLTSDLGKAGMGRSWRGSVLRPIAVFRSCPYTSAMMIKETIHGVDLEFETDPSVFSPKAVDAGTKHLLSVVSFKPDDKVLDLGCGYGVVGIVAARLVKSPSQVFLLTRARRLHGVFPIRVADQFVDVVQCRLTTEPWLEFTVMGITENYAAKAITTMVGRPGDQRCGPACVD